MVRNVPVDDPHSEFVKTPRTDLSHDIKHFSASIPSEFRCPQQNDPTVKPYFKIIIHTNMTWMEHLQLPQTEGKYVSGS